MSGGATVTQNFLVVSMETKHDTLNHNPSPTVAVEKKSLHLLASFAQKGVTRCRIHILMPTMLIHVPNITNVCSEGNLMFAPSVLLNMKRMLQLTTILLKFYTPNIPDSFWGTTQYTQGTQKVSL